MDLSRIQRLQQQAALLRAARLQQNTHTAILPTRPHGVASSYDADSGMDVIRLSDGSTSFALSDTSGVRSPGDSLVVRQGGGTTHIDAVEAKRTQPVPDRRKLIKTELHTFKILFSVVEGDIQKFYIGGDRPEPLLIFEIDTSIYQGTNERIPAFLQGQNYTITGGGYIVIDGQLVVDPATGEYAVVSFYIGGYISNLGKGLDDWIVGIRYFKDDDAFFTYDELRDDGTTRTHNLGADVHYLTIITPTSQTTYSDYDTLGIGNLEWKGGGMWTTSVKNILDLMDSWFWERELEYSPVEEYLAEVTPSNAPQNFPVVSGDNWSLNSAHVSPFKACRDFIYDPADHESLRDLYNQCQFDLKEIFARDPSSSGNNQYYIPPNRSYFQSSHINPSTSHSSFILYGQSFPYAYTQYSDFYVYEKGKGGRLGYSDFNRGRYGTVGQYLASHTEGDGSRKYLLINGINLEHQIDYAYKFTDGEYKGGRQIYQGSSDQQAWTRIIYTHQVNGTSYLLPLKTIGEAKSLVATDQVWLGQRYGSTGQDALFTQNYAETVVADINQQTCIFKKANLSQIHPVGAYPKIMLIPNTIDFFVYSAVTDTEYQIIETQENKFNFNPATDTFISKNGYQKIGLDEIPNEIKTETKTITPKVEKYVPNGNTLSIQNLDGSRVKIQSLSIDTTNTHYIHNLSYF